MKQKMEKNNFDYFINRFKLKNAKLEGDELHCLCPNPDHNDIHLGNFSINITNGKMHCFACGYKNNIFGYALSKNIDYNESIWLWRNLQPETELIEIPKKVDKIIYEHYKKVGISDYAAKRVDRKTLETYNVYSDEKDNPIFFSFENNQINSYWVREHNKYYLIESKNSKEFGDIFGLHLPTTNYNILTEGFFDAMSVYEKSGYVGLSGYGTFLTNAQINKLKKIPNLIIMMDGDAAGRKARDRIVKKLINKPDLFVCGKYNCDPDELSKEQLLGILDKKMSIGEYQLYCIQNGVKL